MNFIDLTNKKFGRLTVLSRGKNNRQNKTQWLCLCECGNEKIVSRNELINGDTRSCGCYKKEKLTSVQVEFYPEKRKRKYKISEPYIINEKEELENFIRWFFEKVEKTDSCWSWKASKDKDGYGNFKYKNIGKAHRFSYFIHKGKIGINKLICHTCDNPSCVNPDHLFEGTHKINSDDKMSKGRWKSGRWKNHKLGAVT